MSKFTDFFLSKDKLAQNALQAELAGIKDGKDSYKADELIAAFREKYDAKALDKILAKKSVNSKVQDAKDTAQLLKQMKAAETALKNGDIRPVMALAQEGRPNAFKEITKDVSNPDALKAKASLWAIKANNQPKGDHGDKSFGRTINFASGQALEAIQGYSNLGMQQECQETMQMYMANNKFDETNHLQGWLNDFHAGEKENLTKGLAAYNIAKNNKNLSFADHLAAAKFHPDDAERTASIQTISEMSKPSYERTTLETRTLREHEDKQCFEFLANHIKTNDGSTKPSQLAAMKALMEDHRHVFTPDGFKLLPPEGEKLLNTLEDELRMGTPHVVQEAFLKRGMQYSIGLNASMRQEKNISMEITDLIPSDLEGPQVNKTRNLFAQNALKEMAKKIGQGNNASAEARQVALLSRDVLLDPSQNKKSEEFQQAAENLRQLIMNENGAAISSHQNLDKILEVKQGELNSYYNGLHKEDGQEILDGTRDDYLKAHPEMGYGRAMLDALKAEGTEEMREVTEGIEKYLPEKFVPSEGGAKIISLKKLAM